MSDIVSRQPTLLELAYESRQIRVEMIDGEPWFCAADICAILELVNVSQVLTRVSKDDILSAQVDVAGRRHDMLFVSESGLYDLVFESKKPEARKFRHWVTSDILPTIRKTGGYSVTKPLESRTTDVVRDDILSTVRNLLDELETVKPKAIRHDRVMEVDGGWYLATVARMFDFRPKDFNALLRQVGATCAYVANSGEKSVPSPFWLDRGWMKRRGALTPIVTPEGLSELETRLGRKAIDIDTAELSGSDAVTAAPVRASHVGGKVGTHNRWHVDRGVFNPKCELCQFERAGKLHS